MSFSSDQSCKSDTLVKIQSRMAALEGALRNIAATKKHLKQNAMDVKSEIHTSISRQLESLRNREVWLLSQVELVQQAKEDVLGQQEDSLNQALGGLQNCLDFDTSEPGGEVGLEFNRKLKGSLDRLDELELRPEETPYLSFHANSAHLKEAIRGYGQIDGKHLPLQPFADPEMSSTCLPQAFEEYEDDDHHVLYKTVGETLPSNVTKRVVNVTLPTKMCQPPQKWLFIPPEAKLDPVMSADGASDLKFPPFQTNLEDWMTRHAGLTSVKSNSSIHQWLREIQGEADIEDGDYEVISPTIKSSSPCQFFSDVRSPCVEEEAVPLVTYFQRVLGAPLASWLLSDERVKASCEFGSTYPYQTMIYFREICQDVKYWLADYQYTKQQEESVCCKGSCATTPVHQVDIENLDTIVCLQDAVTKYFREVSSDPALWLLQGANQDNTGRPRNDTATDSSWTHVSDDDRDVDEQNVGAVVQSVCRANEPCNTFSECVADENCCMQLTPKNSPSNIWLRSDLSGPPTRSVSSPDFAYFKTISHVVDDWLSPQSSSRSDLTCSTSSVPDPPENKQTTTASNCEWLASTSKPANDPHFSYFNTCPDSAEFWLNVGKTIDYDEVLSKPLATPVKYEQDNTQWLPSKTSNVNTFPSYSAEKLQWLQPKCSNAEIAQSPAYEIMQDMFKNYYVGTSALHWLSCTSGGPKETTKGLSKESELPEMQIENREMEELFSCFRRKSLDMQTWLLE